MDGVGEEVGMRKGFYRGKPAWDLMRNPSTGSGHAKHLRSLPADIKNYLSFILFYAGKVADDAPSIHVSSARPYFRIEPATCTDAAGGRAGRIPRTNLERS